MDTISKVHRSWNMSKIKSRDTKPELLVRSLLHSMGYRFRLNGKVSKKYHEKGVLPGKPDIVLVKYKTVIFVHGCFWHRHEGCKFAYTPKTRIEFWENKLNENKDRDFQKAKLLEEQGWNIKIVWECETKDQNRLISIIKSIAM